MAWLPLLANVIRASVLRQSHSHDKARCFVVAPRRRRSERPPLSAARRPRRHGAKKLGGVLVTRTARPAALAPPALTLKVRWLQASGNGLDLKAPDD